MSGLRFELSPQLAQRQIIAPRMIQSMEILQLPVMALQEKIQQELQENPFLVEASVAREEEETAAEPEFNPDAPLKHDDTGDLEFSRLDEINKDWGDVFNEEHRPSRASLEEQSDRKLDAMQNIASAPQSLQDLLLEQLHCLEELEPDERELAEFVISHLDDNGYLLAHDPESNKVLPIPLDELARKYHKPVTLADVEDALLTVQRLEPTGVGAGTPRSACCSR